MMYREASINTLKKQIIMLSKNNSISYKVTHGMIVVGGQINPKGTVYRRSYTDINTSQLIAGG